jgi:hypothetical protein
MSGLPEDFPTTECWSGVGEGWWPVITATHKAMLAIEPDYKIAQIKEKFGGLRYYWDMPWIDYPEDREPTPEEDAEYKRKHDILEALASLAEAICAHICEYCGRASEPSANSGYWIKNHCGCDLKENR